MDKKIILFIGFICVPIFSMEDQNDLNWLSILPKDIQNYVATFLDWDKVGIENDLNFTDRIKKNYNKYTPMKYTTCLGRDLQIRLTPVLTPNNTTIKNEEKNLKEITKFESSNITVTKENSDPLPFSDVTTICRCNTKENEKFTSFATSPYNRYLCLLCKQKKDSNHRYYFKYLDTSSDKTLENISIPNEIQAQEILLDYTDADFKKRAIELINQGYSYNYEFKNALCCRLIHAFAIHKAMIAFANACGIYLLKLDQQNNEKKFHQLKNLKYNTYKQNHNPLYDIPQYAKVYFLEFNAQTTKLGVSYKPENSYENFCTEIIMLPDIQEPKKTLEEYFRRKLVCKKLNQDSENNG